jgi:mannose-1-phosphate guanylyltransferase
MIHTVIMAGGSGTRFWPASRKRHPKQFLAIAGDETMLGQTAERMLPLGGWEGIHVVASPQHARSIKRILPEMPRRNMLIEPQPRNTAPAIGLAAMLLHERDPEAMLVVLPADHVIQPPGRFRKLVRAACRVAAGGALVTLGVEPTRPETGYGYIQAGAVLDRAGGQDVFAVERFVEKPDRATAEKYLQAGVYYWNSGMFIFSAAAILQALAEHMPELHRGLERVRQAPKRERKAVLGRVFERLEGISIDYGVMERAGNIRMLPCDVRWSDVGSWAALPEVRRADRRGNVSRGDVLAIDSHNCVIEAQSRMVACVDCEDLVVVETDDAVLVCPVDRAQDVRKVVDALKRARRDDKL